MPLFATATEVGIATLIDRFYAKVRADEQLGPIFNGAITDWTAHQRILRDFWSSIVLRSGRYRCNPMGVHRELPPFPQAFFQRWLALWRETAHEVFEASIAQLFIGTAERVAQGLSLGMNLGRLSLEHPSRIIEPLHIVS